jgi:lambda family phage portal protein
MSRRAAAVAALGRVITSAGRALVGDTTPPIAPMASGRSGEVRGAADPIVVRAVHAGRDVDVEIPVVAGMLGERVPDLSSVATVRAAERQPDRRGARAYEAAKTLGGSWVASASGPNIENEPALPRLRARSSDLTRNTGVGARAIQVLTDNLVGTGIRPRSATGSRGTDRRVNELFEAWSQRADPFHGLTAYGAQWLATRSMFERGDSLIMRQVLPIDHKGMPVPLILRLAEGDQIDSDKSGPGIISGVEFDAYGFRKSYWVRRDHPGESVGYDLRLSSVREFSVELKADDVVHVYQPLRAGQVRGVPLLAPVAADIWELDNYANAEAVRKRVEACMVAIFMGITPAPDDVKDGVLPTVTNAAGQSVASLSPGAILHTSNTGDVKFTQPSVSPDFSGYTSQRLREIAAGTGLTYEQLSGDLSGVSFASYRVGRIEFFNMIRRFHDQVMIGKICRPIWDWFIAGAIAAGKLPPRAGGYPVKWSSPLFQSIDRKSDAEADSLEIRNGFNTMQDVLSRRGLYMDDVVVDIDRANKMLDELGIVLDSDPRKVGKVGAGTAPPKQPLDQPAQSDTQADTTPKA